MQWVLVLLGVLLVLAIILLVRALRFVPKKATGNPVEVPIPPHAEAAAEKLAAAIRIPTISFSEGHPERETAMLTLHKELERLFPLVHQHMEKTVVNGYSLAFHWKGRQAAEPGLIIAHMDVVPVEEGTEKDWTHPPFSGALADGFVWGRGAMDIKSHLVSSLQAAEGLLAESYVPERDMWFAFGHDEEIGGREGATKLVEWFAGKGIRFSWVLDEGGLISEGVLKNVDCPLALIGIGEKGFANIRITAKDNGGHASMPPKHSALGQIATFLHRLERKPMKARLIAPVRAFLDKVGRMMPFGMRLILANLWLFKPLFLKVFSMARTGNAMLRTTLAPTMAEASNAPNVLPQRAWAVINSRLLPGDTGETLMTHLMKVAKGMDLEFEPLLLNNPSRISSTDHPVFHKIADGTTALYPDAMIVPYLMMGATDSRKYESVSENQYRFTPYRMNEEDLKRVHGTNERISVDNLVRCVAFFRYMIKA